MNVESSQKNKQYHFYVINNKFYIVREHLLMFQLMNGNDKRKREQALPSRQ